MSSRAHPAVLGIRGWSGSGKTTLLTRLIPALVARGLRVSTIKHAHHGFDADTPGKDSHRHREAGATEVLVTSATRYALFHELRGAPEPSLFELVDRMTAVDLVLVEGFREQPHPKLEVWRAAHGGSLVAASDPHVVAVLADRPDAPELAAVSGRIPVLSLDDVEVIAEYVVGDYLGEAR
ncbi:molybdopterin-guanine dinucleotide biosynthesis protein B [Myxococcota bacterium]|nr:molybdopterin-guanine dinucleotide biosynthesis protein B [Myxococcota bacterium]